jgi:hypothetical protein
MTDVLSVGMFDSFLADRSTLRIELRNGSDAMIQAEVGGAARVDLGIGGTRSLERSIPRPNICLRRLDAYCFACSEMRQPLRVTCRRGCSDVPICVTAASSGSSSITRTRRQLVPSHRSTVLCGCRRNTQAVRSRRNGGTARNSKLNDFIGARLIGERQRSLPFHRLCSG